MADDGKNFTYKGFKFVDGFQIDSENGRIKKVYGEIPGRVYPEDIPEGLSEAEFKKKYKILKRTTTPRDIRFPNMNQVKHCWYVNHLSRCDAALNLFPVGFSQCRGSFAPCDVFMNVISP